MVNINIKIPDEIHKKIRILSTMEDSSLKEYIIKILDDSLNSLKNAKK